MSRQETVIDWYKSLQDNICKGLEKADDLAVFKEDIWERPEGGGGRSRVIENGNVFEKGGVNFSAVNGQLPENIKRALGVNQSEFFASGVSIVLHPKNPWVPIIHMNTRYFEIEGETWWFGGGIDLTPIYIDKAQAVHFHGALRSTCNRFDDAYYSEFKKWADDYFFIKHRNETRGVGGIFYDRLNNKDWDELFLFNKAVGDTFLPSYLPIVEENKNKPFSEENRNWQLIRRGRYVEFNLVYDKGTKFGLETNGRIESILMSLPTHASWPYNFQAQKNSPEQATLDLLRKGVDWVLKK